MRITFKTGFTLIELSIMLVIIGLIIGGVLTGQDLINAARVRSQIKQIQEYSSATHTFQAKYGYLPGDIPGQAAIDVGIPSSDVSTTAYSGDGVIDGQYGASDQWSLAYEPVTFFWHLRDVGLITGNFGKTTLFAKSNFPPLAINPNGAMAASSVNGTSYFWLGIARDSLGAEWAGGAAGPVLTPWEAYSIDTKADDGIPLSGGVLSVYFVGLYLTPDNLPSQCVVDALARQYNVINTNRLCQLLLRF